MTTKINQLMEQDQNSPLFNLSIDPIAKAHLAEASRWAKFLAIIGFIICGLMVLAGLFFQSVFSSMSSKYQGYNEAQFETEGFGAAMVIAYVIIAVIYFFPCLFLYKFATKMKIALATDDQDALNNSVQNLKAMFRYVGIITLIFVVIYGLGLIVGLLGAAA
jgi:preprotein translocase subunit SecG